LEESEMILPTSAGEVVSIDRYSGEVFKQYEIGRSVPSSALFVKHKTLYLLVAYLLCVIGHLRFRDSPCSARFGNRGTKTLQKWWKLKQVTY
jgi:hypothetical protein